ncbi:extracellular solute-binding protein [Paenibacillus nanensis]|uniref:Extracellular solute-binding protein n=1 Tax=Paenibacillus nanensis TaxID=393251 RepID=A0A3A1UX99_9BACL|nr:extracellular solute-binding protein [Paenibacillus nanensis]RIX53157.1 extracellular solute-binding protein [Paenibacillus nanensis]
MKKTGISLLSIILLLSVLAACSGGGNAGTPSDISNNQPGSQPQASEEGGGEPVTLKVLRAGITVTETEFEKVLVERTKEKFPNVTLEWVDAPEDVELEPLITSGTVPDIMFVSTSSLSTTLKDLDLAENLQPYIEKYEVDLTRLKPVVLDTIQKYSPDNELHGIPFSVNLPVLFYNKDIFDKFGVPYPPNDQMSWNQAIELGKQVTRSDNGVDYVGIDLFGSSNIATGLDLYIVDPETGEANVTTPEWIKVFEQLKKSYEVQGYIGADGRYQYANDDDIFYNEQNLAMVAYNIAHLLGPLEELRQQGVELNWDFAPFPNFEENLGTGKAANIHSMIVTKSSKHKDIAFQVIANVLTDESQLALAKVGRVPTVEGKQFEEAYGQDIPVLQGKTVENIFKAPPRNVIKPHKFESKVRKFLEEAERSIAVDGQDVNTALRIAQESIEKELETLNNTSN